MIGPVQSRLLSWSVNGVTLAVMMLVPLTFCSDLEADEPAKEQEEARQQEGQAQPAVAIERLECGAHTVHRPVYPHLL